MAKEKKDKKKETKKKKTKPKKGARKVRRGPGLKFMATLKSHNTKTTEEGETRTISIYGEVKDDSDERLFTDNTNLNNVSDKGWTHIEKALGRKITPTTPLEVTIQVADGETLDQYPDDDKTEQAELPKEEGK